MKHKSIIVLLIVAILSFSACAPNKGENSSGANRSSVTDNSAVDSSKLETNSSMPAESSNASTEEATVKPLVATVGYNYTEGDDYIHYTLVLENPNDNIYVDFPSATVAVRSEDGSLVGSDDATMMKIGPLDIAVFSGQISNKTHKSVASIEATVTNSERDYKKDNSDDYTPTNELFEVSGVSITEGEYYGADIIGEIQNNSGKDSEMIAVCLVLYNGDTIVGGATTYIENIPVGTKLPFELKMFSDLPEYTSYKIFIQYW